LLSAVARRGSAGTASAEPWPQQLSSCCFSDNVSMIGKSRIPFLSLNTVAGA
jgi:hypothetical protein